MLSAVAVSAQHPAPGTPGPEHAPLLALVGSWDVSLEARAVGAASAATQLGDRFLAVELRLSDGPIRHAIYTFGSDRRHDDYTVIAMDDSGTYAVSARGTRQGDEIAMYGTDDDPVITSLGFTKEFVIALRLLGPDEVEIETRFVDTRTAARTEQIFVTFELSRR